MLNSFIYTFSWFPTPFILPIDSQSYTLSIFVFSIHCGDDEVNFRTLENSFYIYFFAHQCSLSFFLNNQIPDIGCLLLSHIYFWYWLPQVRIFPLFHTLMWHFYLIVHVIYTGFNINVPFFISWKIHVVFVKLTYRRCSNYLLGVDIIKENKLGGCQRWKLFFVVPVWFMSYFRLLPFVYNKQYGEGEMSWVVVYVYVFAFIFLLTISPVEACWAWSTIASFFGTFPLSVFLRSSYLVVFSEFFSF